MFPKDSDSSFDGDWDDPEELGWSEFEWEKYLRSQEDVVRRYIGFYEQAPAADNRLDLIARQMGWDAPEAQEPVNGEYQPEEDADSEEYEDVEPYTIQRNPAFIATAALYQLIGRSWEHAVSTAPRISAPLALAFQSTLFQGERQALIGLHSLDLGDFTLAIAQFKRALRELNESMRLLSGDIFASGDVASAFARQTLPRLFDLREVLLRVLRECRDEIERHPGNTGDGDDEGDRRSN